MYSLDLEIHKYLAITARECIQKYVNCSIYNKKTAYNDATCQWFSLGLVTFKSHGSMHPGPKHTDQKDMSKSFWFFFIFLYQIYCPNLEFHNYNFS